MAQILEKEENIYKVDPAKKHYLYRNLCEKKIWPMFITWGLLAVAAVFNILLLYFGYFSDVFIIRDELDSNFGQINFTLVMTILIAGDVLLAFLAVIGKLVTRVILGKEIPDRIDESIEVQAETLIYSYRNSRGATPGDRVEVTIPLENVQITYDQKTYSITLNGRMRSMYYENYSAKQTRHDGSFSDGTFVLYDYFTPSIRGGLDAAKEKIRIREEKRKQQTENYAVPVKEILRVSVTKNEDYANTAYVIWNSPEGVYITGLYEREENAAAFKRNFIRSAKPINQFLKCYTSLLCANKEELEGLSAEEIEKAARESFLNGEE